MFPVLLKTTVACGTNLQRVVATCDLLFDPVGRCYEVRETLRSRPWFNAEMFGDPGNMFGYIIPRKSSVSVAE